MVIASIVIIERLCHDSNEGLADVISQEVTEVED